MKLYLLDLGYIDIDANKVVYDTNQISLSDPDNRNTFRSIPVEAALVITDDGHKILYDTGSNYECMNGYWPEIIRDRSPFYFTEEQRIEKQLEKCGYKTSDIDTVVISHMHIDHIGNLNMFTHAKAYVDKAEFEFSLYMAHVYADPEKMPDGYMMSKKEEINCPMQEYICIENDTTICEGVRVITLPGHSKGLLGLQVSLERTGTVLLTSDACYTRENYGPPVKYSNVPFDSVKYRESMEKIRRIEHDTGAMLIFGHDMQQYQNLKKAPEYYD